MASQQYSLRWNNYVRHMTSAFESLRSDKDLIDVTLSCEGKKIPAHKMLLSACSSYFKDLFKENPCQHPVIIFRNVTFVDLVALVDFMYNGEVNVEQEQLASFLNTAELLQVQGLTNSSKDQEKFRKTAKEDDRVPGSSSQFDEDGEERTTTPTRTGPPAAKKRKWQSPSRTESPAALLESQTAQVSSGGDEDLQTIDQVPLKTETPEYDDEDDVQAESGGEDTTDEQDIVQKIQKSDQLVLTSNRNRTSNNEHSLFGNNSMDMDSGDMSSFGMAGPSNESMGQDGMQELVSPFNEVSEPNENINFVYTDADPLAIDEPRNFINKDELVSNQDGRYSCSICNRDFASQRLYHSHLDKHQELTPSIKCNKSFSTVRKLNLRMANRRKTLKCNKCGKTFSTSSLLRQHLDIHKDGPDVHFLLSGGYESAPASSGKIISSQGKFICSVCNRTFSHKRSCWTHMAMHNGRTTCSVCQKTFSSLSILRAHYAKHEGKTVCSICNVSVSTAKSLKRHMTSVHNIPADESSS
ncbi:protein tramtrack, beta isoform-like isoform X2 [Cloeon dipterum]|uniref:protein tramtrack, beta isoform-like isoform X2 n=1 Tax=Cloeon dipterum TaxID=197152 RepID=UPI00321FD1C8